MYNSFLLAGKSEICANKETAVHWFKNLKAFDTIDKNKSYAQALLCNLHQETPTSGEVWQAPTRRHMLYTSTSDADNGKFGKKPRHSCQQANSQKSHKRQLSVKDCKNYKNCQKIGNTGSVTEATETMKPLQLTNRFQPLLQIPTDDVCFSQPMLNDQTKSILVGKKNKNGFLERGSNNISNIIPTQKQPVSNGFSQNVEAKKCSIDTTAVVYKSNKNLVEQKIESLERDSIQKCNTIYTPFHKDCYGTTTNSLSMHKSIDYDTQTGNLEPQYQEMTLEPSINSGYVTPHDHMFEQSELQPNKDFSFIPKSSLKLYVGPPVTWNELPDILQTHTLVKASKLPNCMGCRIPVNLGLNIPKWRHYLANYWDQQLCDLLEYGFPLDFDRDCPLNSVEENQTSANDNTGHIAKFLQEELQYQAILGPFNNKPIDMHISPLLVRDKQNSNAKRTIMDLSWSKGASVNNGVAKDVYLSTHYELKFPSVDLIMNSLRNLGPSAQMFKIDISRAFRHIKVDPGDIDLLGIKFRNPAPRESQGRK